MKIKRLFASCVCACIVSGMMIGCGNNTDDYGPDEPSVQLVEPTNVISKYTKDPTDYTKLVMEETTKVRIHYRRNDDDSNNRQPYTPWNMWAWDMTNGGNGAKYDFEYYDIYGVFVDIPLSAVGGGKIVKQMGIIVRTDDWTKDPDGDRSVEIPEQSLGGFYNVYLMSGDSTIFEKQDDALKTSMTSAYLKDGKTVRVIFKPKRDEFKPYPKRFSVKINGNDVSNFKMGEYETANKAVPLTFNDGISLSDVVTVSYKFDANYVQNINLLVTSYFDTTEFNDKYSYSGNDLGVTFDNENNPSKTTFKVWAPTSQKIKLRIYNTGNYLTETSPVNEYDMVQGDKGVWSYVVNSNLDGKYYTYVPTNSKGTNEVCDPYAKSAGLNGRRGMILNFTRLNNEIDWESDTRPNFGSNNVDGSIYEAHIRDMTINPNSGVSAANRGKFLGLAEKGTTYTKGGKTVSTGLDHIKELGITHIQIQPSYDYNSVDESKDNPNMSKENYNWGYDPQNYNCLEGSYSSNPSDGESRVKEFKAMVKALHQEGISVNMDVVYNHTGSTEGSVFSYLVPNYYYRTYTNGKYYNGSGCGNEVASERYMANKFIRESTKFWVEQYHISGFRFDLMGLIDNQTMIDVYNDCKALYDKIMIYGEPWTGGTSKLKQGNYAENLKSQQTIQSSLAQDYFSGNNVLVGAFNDVIRNAVRGDNNPGRGYVQGQISSASTITLGIKGTFSAGTVKEGKINPNQVINYVSCHDNYTLYDQLIQTMKTSFTKDAYTQADAIIFLAEGIPFIQEGEEFMRSKKKEDGSYDGNSYNVGDFINNMNYELKVDNEDVFNSIKELIDFRKAHNLFRLSSRDEINTKLTDTSFTGGLIKYKLSDGNETLIVLHTTLAKADINLGANCDVIYDNQVRASKTGLNTISLNDNESVVLKVNS